MPHRADVALRPHLPSRPTAGFMTGSAGPRGAVDSSLDRLHRRLAEQASMVQRAFEVTDHLVRLYGMALKHVVALREQRVDTLPWRVGLFGRAHVTRRKVVYLHPNRCGSVKALDLDSGRRESLARPDMRYGSAIEADNDVTTEADDALLLFDDGTVIHLPPYHTGAVPALARPWVRPRPLDVTS